MCGKNLDELAGEGNFWHEQKDGFLGRNGVLGEVEINIGFTATGDAM